MAITVSLIVEDGTGKADANSYAALETFRAYWAQQNVDYSDNTVKGRSDNDLSAALIQATEFIDGHRFYGERKTTEQALEFPRSCLARPGSSHFWPTYLPDGTIPRAVVNATCYMAGVIVSGKDLFAPSQKVSSQSVSGVGSVSYSDGTGQWYYPRLLALLTGLVNHSTPIERIM